MTTQYRTERKLVWLYGGIVFFSLLCVVCSAIAWSHWKETLNVCPGYNTDCGCILFGQSAFQYFTGGHMSYCYYVVFAPLIVIFYALIYFGFHLYRVCINSIGKYEDSRTTNVEQREGESIIITSRARIVEKDPVVYCWIPSAIVGSIFFLYCLIHASIFTAGYYRSCNQYRSELIKNIRATGNQVVAIHSRLQCQAIFDFMDYLQPDTLDRHRGDFINTGACLQIALVADWIVVFLWITVIVYASVRAHKDRETNTCCGK